MKTLIESLHWPESGLLPAIAQDARTGQVLTLAWQNREALAATLSSGQVHYWSRRRQALWRKGETSGHTQRLIELRTDCDQDTILMLVEPAGPACHTGRPSCFYYVASGGAAATPDAAGMVWRAEATNPWPAGAVLDTLAATIEARVAATAAKSYTRSLLDDPAKAAAKVMEEAAELVAACQNEPDQNVAAEAADLIFHLLVLARSRGVCLSDIARVLAGRFGTGGYEEKARRDHDRVADDTPVRPDRNC